MTPEATAAPPKAVIFDRDGTLVENVPYNGDPALVRPVPGAGEALALLRAHGVRTACATNQSAVGLGLISADDVRRVNSRVDELIGPLDAWAVCPHVPGDGCACRKPAPGLVLEAAARLGVPVRACVVIGDILSDVTAATAAGARGVLVPTPLTEPDEVRRAPVVRPDLLTAVRSLVPRPDGEFTAREAVRS